MSRFIPAFASTKVTVRNGAATEVVPAKRPITIRDLLTHTAGISYGTQPDVAALYEANEARPCAGQVSGLPAAVGQRWLSDL